MSENVGSRLKLARNSIGLSIRSMARTINVSMSTWQRIETTNDIPSGETLLKIAELGFNTHWILTGQGSMRLDAPLESADSERHAYATSDPELLARLNGVINKVYKDTEGRVSPEDMGRIAAEKYASILEASDDPDERLIMAKLFETELRKEIEKRRQNLGNTKASA